MLLSTWVSEQWSSLDVIHAMHTRVPCEMLDLVPNAAQYATL